jgi:hypothetical protein
LYGIFPSFFNGSYLKDGKWVDVRYFSDPKFYNRDRALFKKYIPILRKMFDTGWQAVTRARAEPAAVRVERYGPGADGELLFAVYNPAKASTDVHLEIDAAGLGLKIDHSAATALVSDRPLSCRPVGPKIEIN